MTIAGPYAAFAHLESVYLGILADRSGVATKTRRIVEAAAPRPVLFFGDRFKDFRTQTGDGWAAHVGGAGGVCTDAHAFAYDGEAAGTMPHALIAACGGSTVEASRRFIATFPDVPLVALVDYENDCVKTALDVAHALGDRLRGVRLDTSEKLVDESLRRDPRLTNVPEESLRGVNRYLCENVRRALDAEGFHHVQIIASGGMTPEKVARLKEVVDVFGVGSSLLKSGNDFTADIVLVNGKPQSKIGRAFRPNDRLVEVSKKISG
jgi:nicotinate phosphoribosyltransferase